MNDDAFVDASFEDALLERKKVVMALRSQVFGLLDSVPKNIENKIDHRDLVTNVDKELDKLVVDKINDAFPEDGVVAEESGTKSSSNGFTWYIDSIDGTTNFLQGIDNCGTSVGLVLNGEMVMGIIFFKQDKKVYWAIQGKGAYCEDERLFVNSCDALKGAVMNTHISSRPQFREEAFSAIKDIYPHVRGIRITGAAITDFILVAKGLIECSYAYSTFPHDFCAGTVLVREAGGTVTNVKGPLVLDKGRTNYVVSNGKLHDDLLKLIDGRGVLYE